MKLYSFIPAAMLFAAMSIGGLLKSATVETGTLIKGSLPAVYYVGADNKRYVFPNDKVYFSWYNDFSAVTTVTDAALAAYTIGGNVTYRPGVRMVKIQSDPRVYAVATGGVLRWVSTEAAAVDLFGSDWNKKIDDISDSFFVNYKLGANVVSASDFSPNGEKSQASSINADKGLNAAPVNANTNANANSNTPANTNSGAVSACAPACGLNNACVQSSCQALAGQSNLKLRAFVIDSLSTCFVGDAYTTGDYCVVGGVKFAKNDNLKAVRPIDKYLYADKQQLCGKATVSSGERTRLNDALTAMSNGIGTATSNKVNVGWDTVRLSGDMTVSRVPGTCDWWVAPNDIAERVKGSIDNTIDSVMVVGSRNFDFGSVPMADAKTVDQASGLGGAGYSFIVKEWEADTSGGANPSQYRTAFETQMSSSLDLGLTDPKKSYIGNYCRDGKRDMDETGLDCGGSCNACP